jgi:hypothetical protein
MTITSFSVSMLLVWALVGLRAGLAAGEGTTMDDKVRQKIAEVAAEENGWKVDEVRVDEVEELRRPSCSFYTADHTVRPISYLSNYALLGQQQVLGAGDGSRVGKIIASCSDGAPADWWAEIVTRFHHELGEGVVLQDKETRPEMTRKLAEAGKPFAPPTLDRKTHSLSYLFLDPETYVLYHIQARPAPNGSIEVVKGKVL